MSKKVMIVGTGNVGASIAYALINQRTAVQEVILTDLNMDDAEGEAMDLSDTLAVAPSYLKISIGDYQKAQDCDICIITAGAKQKVGETRTNLVQKNAKILRVIIDSIMASGFQGIFLIVSNPIDTLTYLAWQYSGLPAERVIGSGTVLDSARLRYAIAQKLKVHPKSVHAYQVGEHGDTEVTLWSTANLGGEKITQLLDDPTRTAITKSVREKAYEIIKRKGATHYGIGACTLQIINSILNDERRILPISSYDDCAKTYYGFPTVVGKEGAIKRLELQLSETEGIELQTSINAIKQTLQQVTP